MKPDSWQAVARMAELITTDALVRGLRREVSKLKEEVQDLRMRDSLMADSVSLPVVMAKTSMCVLV